MKRKLLLLAILFICDIGYSQNAGITRDGNYAYAFIDKTNDKSLTYLVVQSTTGGWKKEYHIIGRQLAQFSPDNKQIVFLKNDSLCSLHLGTNDSLAVPDVNTFQILESINNSILVWRAKSHPRQLVTSDLNGQNRKQYDNVVDFTLAPNGKMLLLNRKELTNGSVQVNSLYLLNLVNKEQSKIWEKEKSSIIKTVFSNDGSKLAFLVKEKKGDTELNSIWFYSHENRTTKEILNDEFPGIDSSVVLDDGQIKFIGTEDKVLFSLKRKPVPNPHSNKTIVWSYIDPVVQSLQQVDNEKSKKYLAVFDYSNSRIMRLEFDDEKVMTKQQSDEPEINSEYALVYKSNGNTYTESYVYSQYEFNWNKKTLCDIYLVSLKSGKKILLKQKFGVANAHPPYFYLCPFGKYVIGYDNSKHGWILYDILNNEWRNLTGGLKTTWTYGDGGLPESYHSPLGVIGWLKNDSKVLLQDHFTDIWEVDIKSNASAKNITQGFAKKNGVSLQLNDDQQKVFHPNDSLLLVIQGKDNNRSLYKNRGYLFKSLSANDRIKPVIDLGENYNYTIIDKAFDATIFLVSRDNFKEPPAILITKDFKKFTVINSNEPEGRKAVRKELLSWKTFDGTRCQGLLYFPHNFDSTRKYPVIVTYYQIQTSGWNYFEYQPGSEWSGYLVFKPDIHYEVGKTGPSVYNCVVSGVQQITRRKYVNAQKIGITGASFGGYETNYLVTHSNMFAAALSCWGFSDFFSFYGEIDRDAVGRPNHATNEVGQNGMGITPWERPDLYLKNSAVWFADKVTTPVLISHNTEDYRVPFDESVQLFKALRRLNKKAWLISAPGGHGGPQAPYAKQFFDHYLRGMPAPKWMLEPVPYADQGNPKWLELDSTGKTPGDGLLMKNEVFTPQQKELLKHGTTVNKDGRIVDVINDKKKKQKK
jgi:dipeptidyl aminopeptidase/acylaminoacyl peptidase